MTRHRGSCHCARVTFEIEADAATVVVCNCSVCTRKGIIHVGVSEGNFRLLSGDSDLTIYRFGSNVASHSLCRHCGIHAFGRPPNDPNRYAVNVRCLDDYEAGIASAKTAHFDGKNHPKDRGR